MKRCKRCHFPDTRPGIKFNKEGVCQACLNYDKRKDINWTQRKEELKNLCKNYKRSDGFYDCVIGVSGGKDSYYLVYTMKKLGMNPLLVTSADYFTTTKAGAYNLRNLCEKFNCDHIKYSFSQKVFKDAARLGFEEDLNPLEFMEAALYALPLKIALKFKIPLIIFGENTNYEYGCVTNNYYNATPEVVQRLFLMDIQKWEDKGFKIEELNPIMLPTEKEMQEISPLVLYLSYFTPWSSTTHLKLAKRYGFHDLEGEWDRQGTIENFEQIDSKGYMVHLWLKYPKFGFQRANDIASRRVRGGDLTLKEAKRLIAKHDHILDSQALEDFLFTLGYTEEDFWHFVEKHMDKELFPGGIKHES